MSAPVPPPRSLPIARGSLDQTVDIETPEQVVVSYTIAGLGSRTFAALVDYAVCIGGLITLALALVMVAPASTRPDTGTPSAAWALAIVYLAQFVFVWGYYVLCEGLADGRTIGKRLFRLRVVHDDGFSISLGASAIRNLLRLVDLQPGILGTVGMVAIGLSPRGKRLGDSVAGTIVVHERPLRITAGHADAASNASPGDVVLTDAEFDLLDRFMQRRASLPPEERARLASRVADRLRAHLPPAGRDAAAIARLHTRERSLRWRRVAARSDTGGASERHALVAHGAARWAEYASILERAQRVSLKRLTEREVREFAARYREISSDLARLRTASRSGAIDDVFYLSRLVAAGHNLLYRHHGLQLTRVLRFLVLDVPAEVRRSWRHAALAAVFLFLPWTVAHVGVVRDPQVAGTFLPREMLERARQARSDTSGAYVYVPKLARPVMASTIIANNVQVSFAAFAFGVTAGIGTMLLLVFNGISLGGVTGLYAANGVMPVLLSFVAPHGVLELTAICIAGGGGLLIATALLLPGARSRRAAMVENGRRAITLMAAVVMLLIVAGAVEGMLSPADAPLRSKLAVSAATALGLLLYFAPKGRRAPSVPDSD